MNGQYLKLGLISFVVLLLVGACAPAPTPAPTPTPMPPTPTPGPVDRVMAFQEAFNKGAVDETAAMFVDDKVGVVLESLGLEYRPTGVRNNLEYAAGTGLKLEFSDCKPEGDAVNCTLLLRDDACLKSSGLDPAQGAARIKFLGDKINLLTTTMVEKDDGKCNVCMYSLWGRSDRPAVVEKLNRSPGADITARQQGEMLAQLCKDWAVASSRTPTPAPPAAAPPTPAADLVAPVKAYVDALNAGNVDAALALFGEDVKWGDHIVNAYGKEQLRTKLEWLIAAETKQQITDCQPQADRVICRLSRIEACMPSAAPVKLVFIYQPDGKVKQANAGHDGPEWDAVVQWWDAQAAWAKANHADEWAKAQDRTKEGGLIDAKLCKEYAASLSGGDKIQNAMNAAPKAIAVDATIVDWPDSGGDMAVLRKGANDWTCYPDWTVSPGNDPECNDVVMDDWFRALLAGEKEPPAITGPGISYMLMGGSDPSNTDPMAAAPAPGEDWIASPAHVMLIVPGGFDAKQFSTDPKSGGPYIMWDGTPYEHLMVPLVPMSLEEMGNVDATMKNAMSAAPAAIAKSATILGWPEKASDPMVVLRKGTNEWTCIADWPASPGNDPACNDPMWTVWNDALAAGTAPEITAPGIAYMLVGGSDPSNTDPMATAPAPGEDWVNSGPHIMLLVPGGFDSKVFPTDPKSGGPYIMWDGTPYEHVMLPVMDMPQ